MFVPAKYIRMSRRSKSPNRKKEETIKDSLKEEEEEVRISKRQRKENSESLKGLYLDTIERRNLDFDFEKLCSVSLSNINVYACLVCGKYVQGIPRI